MNINDMAALYGKLPQSAAFLKLVADKKLGNISAQGLVASAAPVFFASLFERLNRTVLFVLMMPTKLDISTTIWRRCWDSKRCCSSHRRIKGQ